MAKKSYTCTNCKQTFTRKFNAERHNNNVHNGIAAIFNKETEDKISDKRNIASRSFNIPAKPETKKGFLPLKSDKDHKNSAFSPNHNNSKNLYKKRLEQEEEEADNEKDDENEQMVLKIIGKLSPYIDIFDSLLLSSGKGVQERNQILAELIISSLSSSDPFAFIKEQIEFYRSLIAMRRAISLTSQYYNIQPAKAKETLKALVMNSSYTKNKVKLKK